MVSVQRMALLASLAATASAQLLACNTRLYMAVQDRNCSGTSGYTEAMSDEELAQCAPQFCEVIYPGDTYVATMMTVHKEAAGCWVAWSSSYATSRLCKPKTATDPTSTPASDTAQVVPAGHTGWPVSAVAAAAGLGALLCATWAFVAYLLSRPKWSPEAYVVGGSWAAGKPLDEQPL